MALREEHRPAPLEDQYHFMFKGVPLGRSSHQSLGRNQIIGVVTTRRTVDTIASASVASAERTQRLRTALFPFKYFLVLVYWEIEFEAATVFVACKVCEVKVESVVLESTARSQSREVTEDKAFTLPLGTVAGFVIS